MFPLLPFLSTSILEGLHDLLKHSAHYFPELPQFHCKPFAVALDFETGDRWRNQWHLLLCHDPVEIK
jgi:hypothetical protein